MTDAHVAIVMLCLFITAIFLGFPIAFTLLALAFIFGWYAMGERVVSLIATNSADVMTNDTLVAVPLFLFMGYLVERSNILDRLFRSIQVAARGVPASLAVAALVTCALFATATGIVGAVVTLMGLLAFPAMLRAGYDIRLASGVICAGGTLGILIPPSIMLIVYGAAAGESVVRLYAAAMLPGMMLAGLYVVYVVGRALLNPSLAPKLPEDETNVPIGTIVRDLLFSFFPLTLLILAGPGRDLLRLRHPDRGRGGRRPGRRPARRRLPGADLEGPARVGLPHRPHLGDGVLPVHRLDQLRLGLLLPGRPAAGRGVHARPRPDADHLPDADPGDHLPARLAAGMDRDHHHLRADLPAAARRFRHRPVFFGVLVALNLQTAFLSPPMAMSAFYLKGISPPHVRLSQIFNGCMPFMAIVFVSMVLLYLFPGIALWLPSVLYD